MLYHQMSRNTASGYFSMDIIKLDASYCIIKGPETKTFRDRWKAEIKGAYFDPLVKRGFKSPWQYFSAVTDDGLKVLSGHMIIDNLLPQESVKLQLNSAKDLKPPFKPYNFQLDALKKCLSNSRCLIKMCTGSGKSLVIAMLAYMLIKSGYKGLLLVPNINLLEQFKSDINSYNMSYLYNNLEVLGGGNKAAFNKPLLISTWQSLANVDKRDFDFLIADECHRYSSDVTSDIIKHLSGTNMRWGFTGTIPDEPCDRMLLEGLFGPVFNLVSARQLINQGLGTPIVINTLWLNYNDATLTKLRDQYQKSLKALKEYEPRNDLIANIAIKLLAKKQNTLVLYSHTEHGKTLFKKIVKLVHPEVELKPSDITGPKSFERQQELGVFFINGEDDAKTREQTRQALAGAEGSILVSNYAILGTGINIKSLHNLIMASPLKSYTTITQSIGRGIRLHESKAKFNVFDIVDNTNKRGCGGQFVRQYRHRLETSYQPEGYDIIDRHLNI